MQDMFSVKQVAKKVSWLADTGIDASGFHNIEYEIRFTSLKALESLRSDIAHSAPSTYTLVKANSTRNEYTLRLRVNSYLFERNLSITFYWITDLATKYGATIINWRVVLRID